MQLIKPFLDDNFLLENAVAERLYHEFAAIQPIIDYHNHLPPQQIATDHRFENITEVWLRGDHYKWRAMRTLGVPEDFITGTQSDEAKFLKWAATVPMTIRNPLFHWTHLELKRYFGITELLSASNGRAIYDQTTELLRQPEYSTRQLLHKMKVEVVCTTDDPLDDLRYHRQFKAEGQSLKMLPAFRPDKAILIRREGYNDYIGQLGAVVNHDIASFDDLLYVLRERMSFFHEHGCRLADHGLAQIFAETYRLKDVEATFKKRLRGDAISEAEARGFSSALLYELGCMYAQRGWVQQFHLGAMRNNNDRMLRRLGPDTGFDSIGDWEQASALAGFLNRLDAKNALAKTILYNLNPRDNEVMATMIGNFNDGSVRGKMQFGSAWWFLDQKDGMEKQLNALSNMGLLSCFVGMLTDSRSFLSFPRHEYFRRILCNLIGRDVHNGELPHDINWLGSIVADICYGNAKAYFDF